MCDLAHIPRGFLFLFFSVPVLGPPPLNSPAKKSGDLGRMIEFFGFRFRGRDGTGVGEQGSQFLAARLRKTPRCFGLFAAFSVYAKEIGASPANKRRRRAAA
jgi:hypothetical protein